MTAPPLEPALYLVSTPIGAARDVTLRALDVLTVADVIAAEDTRTLRKLLDIHGVSLGQRRLVAYHDHSSKRAVDSLVETLDNGGSVACVSEAGTPLLSDPGYELVRAALEKGHPVRSAPGASAMLAALCVSGLPTDRFLFAGFPPAKGAARKSWLSDIAQSAQTTVLYESPRRLLATLDALLELAAPDRPIAICRELTKKFEETLRGGLREVRDEIAARSALKGEIVVVLGTEPKSSDATDVDSLLSAALARLSVKDAVAEVAQVTGLPRRDVYQNALKLVKD
ncbi:MAG: 16S rRNA (cytidine(1402)-2'-O)-methyltransferase [Pseudomonadota bacterium]